jgi:large repetitive protein
MKKLLAAILSFVGFASVSWAQDKATQSLTLTVTAPPVVISPATLPEGMVGLVYGGAGTTVTATGGLAPYTFSISVGTLPTGLALNASTGAISGTPTASGSSAFTVKVADSETVPQTATQAYTVVILSTLTVSTTTLPAANIGIAYTATLAATGGQSPYTWAVTTGSLPSGLTLNATTGVISGTPTTAGTFTFTVTVTDSASNVAKIYGRSVIVAGRKYRTKKVA